MSRKMIERLLAKNNGLQEIYYDSWEENVKDIPHELFESEILEGSGNELKGKKPKFASIASSSALAVNTFALWKMDENINYLTIDGMNGFTELKFESKFKNGIGTPPNLDVALFNESQVLAIECKFLEPFAKKRPKFSDAYLKISDHRMNSKWYELMQKIIDKNVKFEYLDATQLIKHFYGLCFEKNNIEKTLLYLYWQPSLEEIINSSKHKNHLLELEHFKNMVKEDDHLNFRYLSYQELWEQWSKENIPQKIQKHLDSLKKKYTV